MTQEFAATREAINDDNHASTQSRTTQRILLRESLQREDERLREMISSQVHQQLLFGRAFKTAHKVRLCCLYDLIAPLDLLTERCALTLLPLVRSTTSRVWSRTFQPTSASRRYRRPPVFSWSRPHTTRSPSARLQSSRRALRHFQHSGGIANARYPQVQVMGPAHSIPVCSPSRLTLVSWQFDY